MDDDKKVCELTEEEYDHICTLANTDDVPPLTSYIQNILDTRRCVVGPKTFCPPPRLQKCAPFVLAAQQGNLNVVKYLLEIAGKIFDINHSATIISVTTKKKVHCSTALWAASTGGHLDVVKVLVENGASVNQPTLTQSTPLRGASFHGHMEVMDYLLASGADINMPNCIGQSPLCIAAMRGKLPAVKYLIEKGADLKQTTINGYTVMHLSAAKGRLDVVNYLLSIGHSPMFSEARSHEEGYVPCPLFLAASTGQKKVVQELMVLSGCPPLCKSDACLLLGSTRCEISSRGLTMSSRDLWEKALVLREQLSLTPHFLPPVENYGFRVEVRNLSDLMSKASDPNFPRHEAYYQSLIIRERCMGFGDQGLIYFLIRRGIAFCNHGRYREAELVWFRAMEMEIKVCEVEIKHARYGHSEGLQRDLEKDLAQYACGIWNMVHDGYCPDFGRYIRFGFNELEVLDHLKQSPEDGLFVETQMILEVLLYIFASWLYYDTKVSKEVRQDGALCSGTCDACGREFVGRFLRSVEGMTLLHLALTNFTVVEEEEKIYDKFVSLRLLVEALLGWEADEVINLPDAAGERPLHFAVRLANSFPEGDVQELVSPLIIGGAHVDAVSSSGQSAFYICTSDLVKTVLQSSGPSPLVCHCANRIVSEKLPYTSFGLPHHIVELIKLHDWRYATPQPQT